MMYVKFQISAIHYRQNQVKGIFGCVGVSESDDESGIYAFENFFLIEGHLLTPTLFYTLFLQPLARVEFTRCAHLERDENRRFLSRVIYVLHIMKILLNYNTVESV